MLRNLPSTRVRTWPSSRSCRHLRDHRLLEPEHLEHEVGAHEQACSASGTSRMELGIPVAHVIHRRRHGEHVGRARRYAQLTTLAVLDVDRDRPATPDLADTGIRLADARLRLLRSAGPLGPRLAARRDTRLADARLRHWR